MKNNGMKTKFRVDLIGEHIERGDCKLNFIMKIIVAIKDILP